MSKLVTYQPARTDSFENTQKDNFSTKTSLENLAYSKEVITTSYVGASSIFKVIDTDSYIMFLVGAGGGYPQSIILYRYNKLSKKIDSSVYFGSTASQRVGDCVAIGDYLYVGFLYTYSGANTANIKKVYIPLMTFTDTNLYGTSTSCDRLLGMCLLDGNLAVATGIKLFILNPSTMATISKYTYSANCSQDVGVGTSMCVVGDYLVLLGISYAVRLSKFNLSTASYISGNFAVSEGRYFAVDGFVHSKDYALKVSDMTRNSASFPKLTNAFVDPKGTYFCYCDVITSVQTSETAGYSYSKLVSTKTHNIATGIVKEFSKMLAHYTAPDSSRLKVPSIVSPNILYNESSDVVMAWEIQGDTLFVAEIIKY